MSSHSVLLMGEVPSDSNYVCEADDIWDPLNGFLFVVHPHPAPLPLLTLDSQFGLSEGSTVNVWDELSQTFTTFTKTTGRGGGSTWNEGDAFVIELLTAVWVDPAVAVPHARIGNVHTHGQVWLLLFLLFHQQSWALAASPPEWKFSGLFHLGYACIGSRSRLRWSTGTGYL